MARELKPCGTNAAYVRHLRAGEEACTPCKEAHRAENKVRRSIAPESVRVRERLRFKALDEATRRLIRNHKAEHKALYEQIREEEAQWAGVFAEFEEGKEMEPVTATPQALAQALRASRGEWKPVKHYPADGRKRAAETARKIRMGVKSTWQPAGDFDAEVRPAESGEGWTVWAVYLGDGLDG